MNVLDLDLDFFLTDCCPLAPKGERPDAYYAKPWAEHEAAAYLERNLGLSTARPIPGILTETHDGALRFWKEQIQKGTLKKPFSVVHVDAHADLGIGKPGPGFVLNNVLGVQPDIRDDLQRYYAQKQLDEANYLLFALAFRWADRLTLVRDTFSRPDLPEFVVRSEDGSASIRLESYVSRMFETKYGKEPLIRTRIFDDPMQYRAQEPFSFITVAQSPRYAPKEADALLNVISRYMYLVSHE